MSPYIANGAKYLSIVSLDQPGEPSEPRGPEMREVAESESDVGKVTLEPKDRERLDDATGWARGQGMRGL